MKAYVVFLVFTTAISLPGKGQTQTLDTLIDVGGYQLHFRVIAGEGIPILFEAGGGNDGTVWNELLKPVADITGATLITYDRAGFGRSGLDTSKHGILNGIDGLETGLKKLGYDGDIMLVAHSLGGFYSTLYAARHPEKVKAVVLIDANHSCFYNDRRIAATQGSNNAMMNKFKDVNPGVYYIYHDFTNTAEVMKTAPFPSSVPVIDLVSEKTPFADTTDRKEWLLCHRQFAGEAPNRTGMIAYGCGHYIFEDNPPLVVNAIVKAYSETLGKERLIEVLKRANAYSVEAANEEKNRETVYRHSENDLNSWGYSLMAQDQIEKALAVFKLNTELYATSWNVFDSYGEALLKAGRKEEAIRMYKKSVELNPKNQNGGKIVEQVATAGPLSKQVKGRIDSLFRVFAKPGSPGYAIGIIRDTQILYEQGYGSANLDYDLPITPHSAFDIASVSKQFTAACIALLIMDGKLSLESPASLFIPRLAKYPDTIRVKHLIYNTSGITDYYKLPRPGGRSWNTLYYFDNDVCIAASLRQDTLLFNPGEKWDYCNVNYMLLAKIVEKISGVPFRVFARDRLFSPLGMADTRINDDATEIIKNRVTPYNPRTPEYIKAYAKDGIVVDSGGPWLQHPRNSPHYGGSGVVTTVDDLLVWSRNFFTGKFGGKAFYDLMHRTEKFPNGRDNQAFGLYLDVYRGRKFVGWDGGDFGISSQLIRFPDQKLAIVVLSNLGPGEAYKKANEIADILISSGDL